MDFNYFINFDRRNAGILGVGCFSVVVFIKPGYLVILTKLLLTERSEVLRVGSSEIIA